MSNKTYTHPQENWNEKECAKRAKRVFRDGMGTAGGPKGLINCDSANYPSYGQTRRYNGGREIDGSYYETETVPLPAIPDNYHFENVSAWGTIIKKK